MEAHPEYYIQGTELDLARAPGNYTLVRLERGDRLLAYGRDPFFLALARRSQLNCMASPGHAGSGDDRRVARRSPGGATGAPETMAICWCRPEVLQAHLGHRGPPLSSRRRSDASRERAPNFASWPRSTGISNGSSSSRGSTTPYDEAAVRPPCATGHARPGSRRAPSLAGLKRPKDAAGHDSWKISLTGAAEPASCVPSRGPSGRGGHHVPLARAACFFHQGQFVGLKRRISAHGLRPRHPARTRRRGDLAVLRTSCSASPRRTAVRMAGGSCSNASPPGTETGPRIASWPSAGGVPMVSGWSWR